MVLGFEIAANFGDCPINRQQRLAPFHSMPKPQKSKWGNGIRTMHRHCVMQLPLLLLSHLQLSSPPPSLSSALHCVMQLPLLSHLQLSTAWCSFLSSLICSSPLLHLSSPPSNSSAALLLRSPLRDAASSPLSSAALLHLSSSALHGMMQLPLLSSAAFLNFSSPHLSPLLHLSPLPHLSSLLLSTAWCSFLSSLICSSPPPLSTAWCTFLSSLICSSPLLHLLHLTPLLLPSSDLHCVMQLPLLLSHLQLSSPQFLLSSI